MTKKWTEEDVDFALESAWSAFKNTLRTHEVPKEELELFGKSYCDGFVWAINSHFHTILEEE